MKHTNMPLKIYFIAGEASGDHLGGELIAHMQQILGERKLQIEGVGGVNMSHHGLSSLFPMDDISVAGIGPVISRLPHLIRRINQTADHLIKFRPEYLITIDSPDFCFRVAKKVRTQLPTTKFIHVGCPTVWAWRANRAVKWRKVMDRVLALLPFEPEVMAKLKGPDTVYIGHPLVDNKHLASIATSSPQASRKSLLLMPGSRKQEVTNHLPLMYRALQETAGANKFHLMMPTVAARKQLILDQVSKWPWPVDVSSSAEAKLAMFSNAHAAVVASGTATLEVALAGIPTVVIYKTSPLWWLLKKLSALNYVALPNIIAGHEIMPEAILQAATQAIIAQKLSSLLEDDSVTRVQQLEGLKKVRDIMSIESSSASIAVQAIFSAVRHT